MILSFWGLFSGFHNVLGWSTGTATVGRALGMADTFGRAERYVASDREHVNHRCSVLYYLPCRSSHALALVELVPGKCGGQERLTVTISTRQKICLARWWHCHRHVFRCLYCDRRRIFCHVAIGVRCWRAKSRFPSDRFHWNRTFFCRHEG